VTQSPCQVYRNGATTSTMLICQKVEMGLTHCFPRPPHGCPSDMEPCSSGISYSGTCADSFSLNKCMRKKNKGKCTRRSKRMMVKCKKTCGFC